MTGIPAWQAPTAGLTAYAGHVTQLLGAHAVTCLYAGTLQAGSAAVSGAGMESQNSWYAQKFTAGAAQGHVGYIQMFQPLITGSPPPWAISLQADSGGAPSGTPLVTAMLPKELAGAGVWVTIPLPAAVTAGGAYWVVAPLTGDASDYFGWTQSGATSGASTSPNGTTWTAAAYGLALQVYDQSATGLLTATWEDSGARWTRLSYDSGGQVTGYGEYTAGQTANGYTASNRTLTYSGALLTGVA